MHDPADPTGTVEPGGSAGADAAQDAVPASTVLAEVLPGIAVVFGEVPAELAPGLVDFGLVSTADRTLLSTALASVGTVAKAAGTLGKALPAAQGLYRLSDATQALLKAGGTLAVKDGAHLGAVFNGGRIVGQARLVPVGEVGLAGAAGMTGAAGAAQVAVTLGPALASIALQMQLNEITGLVRTNIALTTQVLTAIRNEQWAELTGLVATVERAIEQAREVGAVPASLWDGLAGSEALLRKQVDLYRGNVRGHVEELDRPGAQRREYLRTNAEAIVFDANALLSSLKAWTGYQALRAGRASAAGHADADEARYAEVVVRGTRAELDSALAGATGLLDALTRELRTLAELPGPDGLSLPGRRKDAKAVRQTSARLLEAVEPLADALRPAPPVLAAPQVLCAPGSLELDPYLRLLRWVLEGGETLRALAFPDQLDALGPISAILGGAKEMLAAARDRSTTRTLVAVTDRRIVTARAGAFLEQGEIRQVVPLDLVRYVRSAPARDGDARPVIDLITRDESIRWVFRPDGDGTRVDALAAVLAESMAIPEAEREALLRRPRAALAADAEVAAETAPVE
ncbi:hypothetical protein K353_00722 [Kitasatospora sp. SolWspMP-SS2h]|uniref:hypothetical protein n=1 Tax=Kitasatospora sp. SolWspMP-SS2h TaxID=1305729 RepID=UPI000DB96F53|nr:hypothetical protein [Kitasatospora sp. SolWspMP-SS2h]RAJ46344.1 hypothetical protein K353_00722 [Kitasatospora sp. SolWspMP-SS2h]